MKLGSLFHSIKTFGWKGLHVYVSLKLNSKSIKLPALKHPVYIRPRTTDRATFKQIFIRKEYEVAFKGKVKNILDLGANVGYAAVYFANRYPDATIVAVEPAAENFKQLLKNTHLYTAILPIQSAVWSSGKSLRIIDIGESWGYRDEEVPENTPDSFVAMSIPDLMQQFGFNHLDILKIDVEGTECELFNNHVDEWLDKTNMIIVEFHDWIFPGSSQQFIKMLTTRGFSASISGENHIFEKQYL